MLANGNIGIGTTVPSSKLHSVTTAAGPVPYTSRAAILGVNDSTDITYANSVGVAGQVRTSGGYAIYGDAYGAGGWAGYFDGKGYFSNNVGIGTTSPTALLTLESNSTSPYPGIDIKSTSSYPGSKIRFLDSSGSEVSTMESFSNPAISHLQLNHGYTAAYSSTLNLNSGFLYLSTAGSERMRITNIGRVGIGFTDPQTKLHLGTASSSGTTIEELRIETGTSSGFGGEAKLWLKNGQYGVSTIGIGPDTGSGSPTTYIKYEDYNNKFYITTNSSTRIFIDSSGDVGVGTVSPSYKLDVLGDGRFTNGTHGIVHLGNYGQNISSNYGYIQTSGSLRVNGSVKVSNDTNTPSSSNVGSIRYRTSGNNSYVDMCMQTGASTYAWVNIVTNNW